MEFNGETVTLQTTDGVVTVTVQRDGTAEVRRGGYVCGTLYPVGHENHVELT